MTYSIRIGDVGKLWMPVPRDWDGRGMANVSIIDISPKPDDLYQVSQGNMIAYWDVGHREVQDYSITFVLDLAPIRVVVDPNTIGSYDQSSPEYERYTRPSSRIESDDEQIVQLARQIVGDESNPYRQARLIHRWMIGNIGGRGEDGETALSTLEKRSGSCGGRSWLFVGLLRSLGVPARAVTGLHSKPHSSDQFNSGSFWEDTLGTHVWSEFFLPGHGWIQSDAGSANDFAAIGDLRVVLSHGDDIALGHEHPLGTVSWFHVPHTDQVGYNDPPTQNPGESLTLAVERLP